MSSLTKNKGPALSASEGFTLIEMIVVIAIFGIVTIVVLANLPVFSDRTSLDLVAQEVAIHVRGAQVFGGGGRVGSGKGRPTYGIHFVATNNTFSLFRDNNDSLTYDEQTGCKAANFLNSACELEQSYTISSGFVIPSIFYKDESGWQGTDSLDTLFTRPKLEPLIAVGGGETGAELVQIIIQSRRRGECRAVNLYNNGQIAVTPSSCDPDTPLP